MRKSLIELKFRGGTLIILWKNIFLAIAITVGIGAFLSLLFLTNFWKDALKLIAIVEGIWIFSSLVFIVIPWLIEYGSTEYDEM